MANKRIILNFEHKTNNFNELVQEAFNKDFLNFLVSMKHLNILKTLNVLIYIPDFLRHLQII